MPNDDTDTKSANIISRDMVERSQQIFADIVAKYYGDPDYKAKVDADPTGVLKAEGLEIPEGAKVKLLFNAENLIHIVLPMPEST